MNINAIEDGTLVLTEVFSPILLKTGEGNLLGICMRDDTFEINVVGHGWYRVDMQAGTIEKA